MASATVKVEVVPSPKSVLGEGPHWDAESQSLYYNDIYGTEYSILRYSPAENKTYGATIDGEPVVSFIIPVAGTTDQFAVGIGRRVGIVQWDGKSPKGKLLRVVFEVEDAAEFNENRFNDAKTDPTGRLYAGTMRREECGDLFKLSHGAFYKFAANESLVTLRDPVRISNGLTWNEKTNKFYFIDSCDLDVKEFDYDPATGNICKFISQIDSSNNPLAHSCFASYSIFTANERVVIDFTINGELPGFFPDGMTIDTDGYLYVATWDGSKVMKIHPT